jgi:hypothetical protein
MGFPLENSGNNVDPSQGNSDSGNNPAWNDVLSVIPQELHSQVTPHFSNWDKGVQEKINQVHQQYNPYKPFVESQISPDDLRMGYGLLQAINTKPLDVIRAMKESFGLDLTELLDVPNNEPDPNETQYAQLPPEIQQQLAALQRQSELQGQILLKQREEALAAEQSQILDKELAEARQKYGDFDEEIVLTLMLNGYTTDQAVQRYNQHVGAIKAASNRPQPPQLLGSGSAIPDQAVDPRKLNPRQTKDLVAEMLRAAANNG